MSTKMLTVSEQWKSLKEAFCKKQKRELEKEFSKMCKKTAKKIAKSSYSKRKPDG